MYWLVQHDLILNLILSYKWLIFLHFILLYRYVIFFENNVIVIILMNKHLSGLYDYRIWTKVKSCNVDDIWNVLYSVCMELQKMSGIDFIVGIV